jgi:hypothetical protein
MSKPKPPVVVVDTTEFQPDPTLSRSSWWQTRLGAQKGRIQLWVPEVVIQEAVRHYSAQLDLHLQKLADEEEALSKLSFGGDHDSDIGDFRFYTADHRCKVAALKAGYEQRLRKRLSQARATILPLPRMSHQEMLRRALLEQKPFRSKGEGPKKGPDGYRDMLIWASVAEHSSACLNTSDTLILVTGNHGDFCDGGRNLDIVARELLADLGDAAPTVYRLKDLDTLAEKHLPAQADDQAEIKMQQDLTKADSEIRRVLTEAIRQEYVKLSGREIADHLRDEHYLTGLDFDELQLPLDNPQLRWLEADLGTVSATVYGTDSDYEPAPILSRVTVEAEASIEGYMESGAYDEDAGFSLSLINDYTFEAEGERLVLLYFNVGIDPDGSLTFLDLEKAVPAP